jgi:hypothetical protein
MEVRLTASGLHAMLVGFDTASRAEPSDSAATVLVTLLSSCMIHMNKAQLMNQQFHTTVSFVVLVAYFNKFN